MRAARIRLADTIMIIINFTGIIGYRLYLFSTTERSSLSPYLPPCRRIETKLHTDGKRRACDRQGRLYLQAHKATIRNIKISGRLKVGTAWNRLIKNYFAHSVRPSPLHLPLSTIECRTQLSTIDQRGYRRFERRESRALYLVIAYEILDEMNF